MSNVKRSAVDMVETNDASDSDDDDLVQSPGSPNNSSGYMGQKAPTSPPFAGRRREYFALLWKEAHVKPNMTSP